MAGTWLSPRQLCLLFLISVVIPSSVDAAEPFFSILLPRVLILDYEHRVEVFVDKPASILVKCLARHSLTGESKPCGSSLLAKTGAGSVDIKIPFEPYSGSTVHLTFILQFCGSVSDAMCSTRADGATVTTKSATVPIQKNSMFLFVEKDKPIYKANDLLKFRLLPLYPDILHPSRARDTSKSSAQLKYDLIYLESPSGQRMAQWVDVVWLDALKGFSYQLSEDPDYGKWKVVGIVGTQKDEEEIQVERYVLPQFEVEIKPPKYLLGSADFVDFSVCAKYITGLPMRGKIKVRFAIQGHNDGRPSIMASSILDGTKLCADFKESTKILDLLNSRYSSRQIVLNATVTEDGTLAMVNKSEAGGQLSFEHFSISVDSEDMFNRGLPYYGRARTTWPDSSPYPRANVSIRVESWTARWGFLQEHVSDSEGIVNFVIPPVPKDYNSITLVVASANTITTSPVPGRHSMCFPKVSKNLVVSYSPTLTALQIDPLFKVPQDPCVLGTLKLHLSSNVRLFTRKIHVVATARGEIIQRTVIEPQSGARECQDTNSNGEGHFKCKGTAATDRGFEVTCLPGWRGDNCLTPLCTRRCEKGICGGPNRCICRPGWRDENCTTCSVMTHCVGAGCCNTLDYDCKCNQPRGFCHNNVFKGDPVTASFSIRNAKIPCAHHCLETDLTYSKHLPNRIETANIFRREISIPWSKTMSPTVQVLVYFVYQDKEIVSDSVELSGLTACLQRTAPTSFEFSSRLVRPGEQLTGSLSTSGSNVVCALSVIDVAMSAFGSTGGVTTEELLEHFKKLMNEINDHRNSNYYEKKSTQLCSEKRGTQMESASSRRKHHDSRRAFVDTNVIVLSNIEVITNPCEGKQVRPLRTLSSLPGGSITPGLKAVVRPKIRKFFPESWTFRTLENTKFLPLKAPDSITTWIAYMYCISSKGLGISPPISLKVFQPFFVQMTLPYSLIRGEIAEIPIKIFNYIANCYEIHLSMTKSSDFKIIGHDFVEFCICAFERKTAYMRIKATELKRISIEVTATPLQSPIGMCTLAQSHGAYPRIVGDAVRRELEVEPEGVLQEKNTGDVVCAPTQKVLQLALTDVQSVLVPGSTRGYLSWSGSLLGPALSNLDGLVRKPFGCGEQNMILLVPSIFAIQYLEKSGINDKGLKTKALNFIKKGYDRQLKFRYSDGSYAAFVENGRSGSTWLTAFVLRSFAVAQKYVPSIETEILRKATTFLISKQDKTTGCIREDGHVYHWDMKGGLGSESDKATMTAFVLSCLVEARANAAIQTLLGNSVENAVKCIISNTPASSLASMSSYAVAIRAYALTRWNPRNSVTRRYVSELKSRVVTKNGLSYVSRHKRPTYHRQGVYHSAAEVEMTGYLLLTLFYQTTSPRASELQPSIRWLVQQRNDLGGWVSTQDTVLALNSLAETDQVLRTDINVDLKIKRSDSVYPIYYKITRDNRLLFKRIPIDPSAKVEINVAGAGCAVVQINILFHVKNFEDHLKVSPFATEAGVQYTFGNCKKARVHTCMSYSPPSPDVKATMIVMKAKMASGWKVEAASLSSLRETIKHGVLRRVDEDRDNSLNLYYDPNGNKRTCASFTMEKFINVMDVKPLIFQVYDYYQPEQVAESNVPVYTGMCQDVGRYKEIPYYPNSMCPKCAMDQYTILDVLKARCGAGAYSFVLGTRRTVDSSQWTIRLNSGDGIIKGWTSNIILRSSCTCDLKKEVVLISLRKTDQPYGKPIEVDGSWIVVEPRYIFVAHENLSPTCQRRWKSFPFSYYLRFRLFVTPNMGRNKCQKAVSYNWRLLLSMFYLYCVFCRRPLP